jgi:CheY-like chemotaxis protein
MSRLANVLIVDDNPRCLEFLRLAFEAQADVVVHSELQSAVALGRIRSEKPDLIMLDIKMPEIDGLTMLSMLRGEGNPVPVVMCSGSARQSDVDQAYAQGCSGYVEKPASMEGYRNLAGVVLGYWRRNEIPHSTERRPPAYGGG